MRRANREVTDPTILSAMLEQGEVCHLALLDGAFPYVLPLSYGYDYENGALTLYFHCATTGKKLDCIAASAHAAFSIEVSHRMITAPIPCEYSMAFQSLMGQGRVEVLEGEERLHGLRRLMAHCGWQGEAQFAPRAMTATALLRLTADHFTAKHNIP